MYFTFYIQIYRCIRCYYSFCAYPYYAQYFRYLVVLWPTRWKMNWFPYLEVPSSFFLYHGVYNCCLPGTLKDRPKFWCTVILELCSNKILSFVFKNYSTQNLWVTINFIVKGNHFIKATNWCLILEKASAFKSMWG